MKSTFVRVVEGTGFGNGKGEVSFNKLVTFTALWAWALFLGAIGWLMLSSRQFAPAALVAVVAGLGATVIGAGFGLKGFLGAVKQNRTEALLQHSTNLSANVQTNITADLVELAKVVKGRREVLDGIDPA